MKKGFVLAEFVIALPLLILLMFALGQTTFKIFQSAKIHAADYVLENEAQEILNRISEDARAAKTVAVKTAIGGKEIQEIFFNYHVVGNAVGREISILIYTHRYTVSHSQTGGLHIYAERKKDGSKTNPITGDNFLGDTSVTKLKFTQPKENILHIELEMESLVTGKKFKVSTSVFMSACENVVIKS